jgi:hypothetical protein
MHAKKSSPNGSNGHSGVAPGPPSPSTRSSPPSYRRGEPDLSHLATRKVDSVSSLAAEMMLRQADEDAASGPAARASAPPGWSAPLPSLAPAKAPGRVAVFVVGGLLLLTLVAAAAFVVTR